MKKKENIRAERKAQRAKSEELRAKSEELRAESRAQRAESKQPRPTGSAGRAVANSQQPAAIERISTVYNIKKPSAIEFYVPAEGCISESRAVRACLMIRVFNN